MRKLAVLVVLAAALTRVQAAFIQYDLSGPGTDLAINLLSGNQTQLLGNQGTNTAWLGQLGPIVVDLTPFILPLTPRRETGPGAVAFPPTLAQDGLAGGGDIKFDSTPVQAGDTRGKIVAVPETEHIALMALLGFVLLGAVETFRGRR